MFQKNKSFNKVFINFLFISCLIINSNALNEMRISSQDLSIKIDEKATLTLTLSQNANQTISIELTCDHYKDAQTGLDSCSTIKGLKAIYYINETDKTVKIDVIGAQAGRQTLLVNANKSFVDTEEAFVRINVGHSKAIDVVSNVIGWLYFIAWSVSFYPQIWTNYKRKSVVGLNFDFIGLNITGFLFYSFFNVCLFFSAKIQNQFEDLYPRSVIPVEINDVVFAVHAVFATIIVIVQCFVYERENQTLSLFAKAFLVIVWTASVILAILVPTTHWFNWMTYLYFFSYVKLVITIIKYIPQAWYNYRRQSTIGWSIGNILLDFTGGSLSILQMFLLGYNYDDWGSIFKNFTKFGLGMVSILFDVLFIVQHYVLYREAPDVENTRLTNGLNTSSADLESIERD